jgi:hypothetical protein
MGFEPRFEGRRYSGLIAPNSASAVIWQSAGIGHLA